MDDDARLSLALELLQRANERERSIQAVYDRAAARLERAKQALRDSLGHNDLTQPYLVSEERWNAREVRRASNMASYSLQIPGGGWSVSGTPCQRMIKAQDECKVADEELVAVPRWTQALTTERDLLRSLASDLRSGTLGTRSLTWDDVCLQQACSSGPSATNTCGPG